MGWRDRWAIALLCWASRGYMALLRCAAWLGNRRAVEWVGMREDENENESENESENENEDEVEVEVEGEVEDEDEVEVEGRVVWVHCASLGEYEQGRPVIEAWRARFPEVAVLLTFFSPSGYRPLVARRPPWFRAGDRIAALPADVPREVEAFLDRWGPRLRYAVFVKYEIWPNLLQGLFRRGIPSALVAAHVVPGAWVLRPWGRGMRAIWRQFTAVLVQDEQSVRLLAKVGVAAQTAGDPRADRVLSIVNASLPAEGIEDFRAGRACVVAGSTWPAEEEALLRANLWGPARCLILVPHDLAADHLSELRGRLAGLLTAWWSSGPASWPGADVLVVDAVGHLASLYRHGDVAVVGGGYGAGVHNLLEPAAHGRPLVTGPRIGRFREAVLLHDRGALRLAPRPADLPDTVTALLDLAPEQRAALGSAARELVESESGAAERVVAALCGAERG